MSRPLPPLNSLRAFEAAARHLSFTKAAEELHVTPAAVSQQIKLLEEHCGTKLFRRLTRALMLTDAGQAALPPLREGFDKLAEAVDRLRSHDRGGILTVSVPPSFGAKWLVHRLDRLNAAHPEFDVRIDATDTLVDFSDAGVDIALRYGRGTYPGLHAEHLMPEVAFPVCSPALLEGEHPLRAPEDLSHHTLLHVQWKMEHEAAPNWRMWLRAAGIEGIDAERGPRFTIEGMTVQAAIEGQGWRSRAARWSPTTSRPAAWSARSARPSARPPPSAIIWSTRRRTPKAPRSRRSATGSWRRSRKTRMLKTRRPQGLNLSRPHWRGAKAPRHESCEGLSQPP